MDKATYVADEDDAKAVLKKPEAHWDRSMFSPPAELLEKGRPPRGELTGMQQIVFVLGRVVGSSGLPAADENQLSDPFCVVEAMSRTAGKIFVHRTRVVPRKLCPEWDEAFYVPIPQGFECNRMMFSIYDRDETGGAAAIIAGLDPLEQDEFLGRASVDISYLCSGQKLVEDIPVSGSFVGSQVKTTAGFRRSPTICVELSVQRRIKPCYGLAPEDHSAVIPRRTHKVSRQPYSVVYADPSQFLTEVPLEEKIAISVMEAHKTGRLLKGAAKGEWIQQPRMDVPEVIPDSKPQILELERATPHAEPPGLDFTQKSPVQRCESLPMLHSKCFGSTLVTEFEQTPALFEMTQPHKGKAQLSVRQVFNSYSTQSIMQSLKGLWFKPMPDMLIHRRVEPSSSSPESPHGHGPDVLLR
ncbi:Multiple C2 and transmembrane domain-containing protein [Durusdinium trenchii]|uniref:Multiple C2 and transmembrane domain-containing protein n=1 Tax=Durusdinium trenchii TaxID=1381693 RepID=A0ABP0I4M9_9DINO